MNYLLHKNKNDGIILFFFQAEDGIRDSSVTGVQTCALPISQRPPPAHRAVRHAPPGQRQGADGRARQRPALQRPRLEHRRHRKPAVAGADQRDGAGVVWGGAGGRLTYNGSQSDSITYPIALMISRKAISSSMPTGPVPRSSCLLSMDRMFSH